MNTWSPRRKSVAGIYRTKMILFARSSGYFDFLRSVMYSTLFSSSNLLLGLSMLSRFSGRNRWGDPLKCTPYQFFEAISPTIVGTGCGINGSEKTGMLILVALTEP